MSKVRWGRVVVAGLLAEVGLILAIVPVGLRLGDTFLRYAAPPGSFVVCFLGALWACRRVESRYLLHGVLVGAVAALFYIALTGFQPEPLAYVIAHVLKLAGGAAGASVAQRRKANVLTSSVA
jgi:putative membrane protein (TIGR04086 family)